jgi:hypothetical protein
MRKKDTMVDRKIVAPTNSIEQITIELKDALNEAKNKLKSSDRRRFMAQIVKFSVIINNGLFKYYWVP